MAQDIESPIWNKTYLESISTKTLMQCIEKGIFSLIDFYFAQSAIKNLTIKDPEALICFLCYLMRMNRQGHLCVKFLNGKITPNPKEEIADPELQLWVEKKLLEAMVSLPDSLVDRIDKDHDFPLKMVCNYQEMYYLQKNWVLETQFLYHLKRLQQESMQIILSDKTEIASSLNTQQRQAVYNALFSPISLMSGGPGTGKTFTAVEMIRSFLQGLSPDQKQSVFIKVSAPTGKAAANLEKKITQALGNIPNMECGTLHSLLRIHSSESFFGSGRALFADLFIVDECSMLDARLFSFLLSSIQNGGRLVLIGDENQLPPVEPGCFFPDLIQLSHPTNIPYIKLTHCVRIENKEILALGNAVHNGDFFHMKEIIQQKTPHIKYESISSSETTKMLCEISKEMSPNVTSYYDPQDLLARFEQVRILSCIRRGPFGVETINQMMLSRLLKEADPSSLIACPIMIVENDSSLDLYNGDVGLLVCQVDSLQEHNLKKEGIAFFAHGTGCRKLPAYTLPAYDLAYCLSVHKSQGSEYDRVIILAPQGSEKFGREILYTAITRAKKEVVLVGDENTLHAMVMKSSKSLSGLRNKL